MVSIKRAGKSSGGRKGKPGTSNTKASSHGKVSNPKHHGK